MKRFLATAAAAGIAVAALAAPVPSTWTRVSLDAAGGDPDDYSDGANATPNGRYVVFHSAATDLGAAPGNAFQDVFVRDLKTGAVDLVSRNGAGAEGNGFSRYATISANGRIVAFESNATDLVEGSGTKYNAFAADRRTGEITLVSAMFDGAPAEQDVATYGQSLSSNGRYLVFLTASTGLVEGVETNTYSQVYLRDLRTGRTTLVSRDRDDPLVGATGTCTTPAISANGRFVVFGCNSANLVPGSSNGQLHIYLRDLKRGTTVRVTEDAEGVLGSSSSHDPVVSNNGRWVAFYTYAANLSVPDTPGESDAVLADTRTRTFVNMSASAGSGNSYTPSMSASGKVVVFYSEKSDLVGMDGNGTGDVFRYDPATGNRARLSVNAAGEEGNGYSYNFPNAVSANGKVLCIGTDADNLAEGPEDPEDDTDVLAIGL